MSDLFKVVLIIFAVIGLVILYKWLKPYLIKYDTTLLITGGLGSGKSLTSVKTAIVLLRKQRFYKWRIYNLFNVKLVNFFIRLGNKARSRKGKPLKVYKLLRKKPLLYSNMPICIKSGIFKRKEEYAQVLTEEHLTLLKEIREYSVVLIDEMPQFINQLNWNVKLIQNNVNEFITFFRHYIGGYLIFNAQSTSDIVAQVRRKLNQAVWCFDFHKWLFGLFYTIRMCDITLNDDLTTTTNSTFLEENTKLHFGLFPRRGTYDTRCYSPRYKKVFLKHTSNKFTKIKTTKIIRLMTYRSPLDDHVKLEEQELMLNEVKNLTKDK